MTKFTNCAIMLYIELKKGKWMIMKFGLNKKRKTSPSKAKTILRTADSRSSAIEVIINKYGDIIKNFKGLYIEKFFSDGMLLTHLYPKTAVLVSDNPFVAEFYSDISYKTVVDIRMIEGYFYRDNISEEKKEETFKRMIKYLNHDIKYSDIGITNWYEFSRAAIFYCLCRMASSPHSIKYKGNEICDMKMSKSSKKITNLINDDYKIDYFRNAKIQIVRPEVEIKPHSDDFVFMNLPKKYDSNDALEFAAEFMQYDNGVFFMEDSDVNRTIFEKFKIISKKGIYEPSDVAVNSKNVIAVVRHKGKIYD